MCSADDDNGHLGLKICVSEMKTERLWEAAQSRMSASVLPTASSETSGPVPRLHKAGLKSKDFIYKMGCLFVSVASCFFVLHSPFLSAIDREEGSTYKHAPIFSMNSSVPVPGVF